jgi:CDP-glucose 4,6-dehydratase
MSVVLSNIGANVIGYSSCSKDEKRRFDICGIKEQITHIKGDVRDLKHLKEVFATYQPEIVIHMAAQPLVRLSYETPVETYETNVMGTVHVLEAVRAVESVRSFLNVTTDKVYQNNEWEWGYRETDPLDGYDPYSNSKSCSELVTHSYQKSFFTDGRCAISTARAGNVIGGGDFAADRIIPDCVRAALTGQDIIVRNPFSTRPYQHVLEPLCAYLMIAMRQYEDNRFSGNYNVGPDDRDCVTTGELADLFCASWGDGMRWINKYDGGPHEANFLKLDCSRIKSVFGWKSVWRVSEAVERTVAWSRVYEAGEDVTGVMGRQIGEYLQAFVYN